MAGTGVCVQIAPLLGHHQQLWHEHVQQQQQEVDEQRRPKGHLVTSEAPGNANCAATPWSRPAPTRNASSVTVETEVLVTLSGKSCWTPLKRRLSVCMPAPVLA